uniref:Uncharacterized protein n=1 Tax=Sphaerodactylus townsendi TaxID=933632 RepID=A0ACB8EUK5_9SAUR
MAGMDGTIGLTGEPDEGTGQVPDKDETPCDPDIGDKEKDALIPDRHDPHLDATQSTNCEASMGSPYSWAPSRAAGWHESTWLTQSMDQDIYSEWDPEQDKMRQEIHFLRHNMELLLAHTKAAERDRQDPLQLLPSPLLEGGSLCLHALTTCCLGRRAHPGHSRRSPRSGSV